jgi:hypothetical protein
MAKNSLAAKRSEYQTRKIRIKNEIKSLYVKKQQLNKLLYSLYLDNAHTWGNMWNSIMQQINNNLNSTIVKKHKQLDAKIHKLLKEKKKNVQLEGNNNNYNFYSRVENLTMIRVVYRRYIYIQYCEYVRRMYYHNIKVNC